jgi:hypothetical protein
VLRVGSVPPFSASYAAFGQFLDNPNDHDDNLYGDVPLFLLESYIFGVFVLMVYLGKNIVPLYRGV